MQDISNLSLHFSLTDFYIFNSLNILKLRILNTKCIKIHLKNLELKRSIVKHNGRMLISALLNMVITGVRLSQIGSATMHSPLLKPVF